MEKGRRAE